MNLLLELHGDLPDDYPTDERRLYIFGCARKACVRKPGSIRALRATRKVEIEQPQQQQSQQQEKVTQENEEKKDAPKQDLGASLFGASSLTGNISANANPFSSQASSNGENNNNPFATPVASTNANAAKPNTNTNTNAKDLSETFADKVRISAPEQLPSTPPSNFTPKDPPEKTTTTSTPWPPQSAFPPAYPHYYLDAEHESLSRPSSPTIPSNVTIDNSNANDGTADLKDTFESELDKAFLRFSTRLEHNPEQILRYEFRGEPLLYSYGDEIGKRLHRHQPGAASSHVQTTGEDDSVSANIPRCEYCGTQRVFEMQLVPHAISMLEDGREKLGLEATDDAGMEWGTILVAVCAGDCAPGEVGVTGWREEWVGVQWEELAR